MNQLHQRSSLRSIISTERNQARQTGSPFTPMRNGSLRDLLADGRTNHSPPPTLSTTAVLPPPLGYTDPNKRKYERIGSNNSNLSIISLLNHMPAALKSPKYSSGSVFTSLPQQQQQQPTAAVNYLPLLVVQKNSSSISGDYKNGSSFGGA